MSEPREGFTVTTARVSMLLGLVALLGVVWQSVSLVKDHEYRIATVETYIADDKQITKDILNELKVMNRKLDELTFIVKGVDNASLLQTQAQR